LARDQACAVLGFGLHQHQPPFVRHEHADRAVSTSRNTTTLAVRPTSRAASDTDIGRRCRDPRRMRGIRGRTRRGGRESGNGRRSSPAAGSLRPGASTPATSLTFCACADLVERLGQRVPRQPTRRRHVGISPRACRVASARRPRFSSVSTTCADNALSFKTRSTARAFCRRGGAERVMSTVGLSIDAHMVDYQLSAVSCPHGEQ
jgi:hypothetical protein